jgi:hypothetical protein
MAEIGLSSAFSQTVVFETIDDAGQQVYVELALIASADAITDFGQERPIELITLGTSAPDPVDQVCATMPDAIVARHPELPFHHPVGTGFGTTAKGRHSEWAFWNGECRPEAPLSPVRQLALLALLREMRGAGESQFIIATHSPILMAFPGATIYVLDGGTPRRVAWGDLEHVTLIRDFLNDPHAFLRRLAQ